MKKIPLKALKANFAKVVLEVAYQLFFGLLVLNLTGILIPFTLHGYIALMLTDALRYSLIGIYAFVARALIRKEFNMKKELNNALDTIRKSLSPKNIFKAAFSRIAIGIATGMLTFCGAQVSSFLMYLLFPKQLEADSETFSKYDVSATTMAIHAPIFEEVAHRGLILGLAKLALHALFMLYTATRELFASDTAPTVDIESATQATEQTPEQAQIQEQADLKALNVCIDNSANVVNAFLFSWTHLPAQYLHTFGSGLAYGHLTNEYGDCGASTVAHVTHNTLVTLSMR